MYMGTYDILTNILRIPQIENFQDFTNISKDTKKLNIYKIKQDF